MCERCADHIAPESEQHTDEAGFRFHLGCWESEQRELKWEYAATEDEMYLDFYGVKVVE